MIISSSNESDISIFNEKDESNHYINKKFEDNLGTKGKKYSETKKNFFDKINIKIPIDNEHKKLI